MQSVHHPAPVAVVPVPNPVVELVALVGPHQRELVAAVVHDGVEGDDEVPDPGGGDVAASQEGADADGKSGHQDSVHRVAVASSGGYGSSELVMVLQL